ncbi:MAG: alkaline phosphatase D family protein [Planctomycetales bacterium]
MQDSSRLSRRGFLSGSTAALTALSAARTPLLANTADEATETSEFRSGWEQVPDRVWPGPQFWTNPLQDWRISYGRLECFKSVPDRNIHLLSRDLADRPGTLAMRVEIGSLSGKKLLHGNGSAGFLIGVKGPLGDYRNNLVHGQGLAVGLRLPGTLFIGVGKGEQERTIDIPAEATSIELRLQGEPQGQTFRITLAAYHPADGKLLGQVERANIPPRAMVGNLALGVNFGASPQAAKGASREQASRAKTGPWWFSDWRISGTKVESHADRTFGPLLFNQYTLHDGILKMTVQMPPLGIDDTQTVRLQGKRDSEWKTIAEEQFHPRSRTAMFRITGWDSSKDAPYRLAYTLQGLNAAPQEHFLEGTIRRDPVDQETITVADISCNAHYAFPNTACVASVAKLNPDLLAFTGDQYYESTGGFGVERTNEDAAILDVLRKWFQHGWTWRELMKDRPTVSIPDDHDVYHGNLWGENGKAAPGQESSAEAKGGYKMMAGFVNVVHRMQTAHHPDSTAPAGLQGITGYYSPLTYGRISFAILADRQYKSGPDGKAPPTTSGRADHVTDPNFDPKTADLPGLQLLGDAQLDFLKSWGKDWTGADMKAVISQTIFTAMATHHGKQDGFLVADYDTNAWPQTARDAAVRELRRACVFHIAGDQHLPAVVHYGVESHRDGVIAFASPAVNNLYPRWFRPKQGGANRKAGEPETHGDFKDSFGHPMTVLACANPQLTIRAGVLEAETDKSSGFGVVRFNKRRRTITVECWPLLADPTLPHTQFADWPVTVGQLDGFAGAPKFWLPRLVVHGCDQPVVRIISEVDGETLYTLRLPTNAWQPFTFAVGPHTLEVENPEAGTRRVFRGLAAESNPQGILEVSLS